MWKRTAAGVLGVIATSCGIRGCAYSVSALIDVGQIEISMWWVLSVAALWLLTLGAFWLGVDFVKFAFTGHRLSVPPRLRVIGLGALSFFPGFLIAFSIAARNELLRNANDPQAPFRALAVGAAVGLASVLAVTTLLLKRAGARY